MNQWQQGLVDSFSGHDGPSSRLLADIRAREDHVRVEMGSAGLEFLDPSEGGEPDLALRLKEHSLEEVMLGPADRIAAFRDAEVAAGSGWGAALPAAETEMLKGADFEPIPGASLVAVIRVTSTMFGDIGLVERWQDGALVRVEAVAGAEIDGLDADLGLACTLSQLSALRRREITPPDALAAGARLQTDWPYMGCYFELLQHPAYADAYGEAPAVEAQIAWGEAISSPAYREAVGQAKAISARAS
ncbi:MAG: hypothetical protein ACRDKV_04475 [Solirubrobacterales bacterium]